eukprot:3006190-Prymnesium_polylepis.2
MFISMDARKKNQDETKTNKYSPFEACARARDFGTHPTCAPHFFDASTTVHFAEISAERSCPDVGCVL